ncbi:MAG: tetratricopeptide repeat protein [Hyphomicrobiaceae bacterium]|nr:tetratricopeptide repeat protein [Hyphomicrobiaceae bacterium]
MNTASPQPQPAVIEDDAPTVAGTLQELLSEISTSVDLADRRYADIVSQMQEKLAALDNLAKSKREKAEEDARRKAEEETARKVEEAKRLVQAEEQRKTEAKAAKAAAEAAEAAEAARQKAEAEAQAEAAAAAEAARRKADADAQAEADRLAKAVEAAKAAASEAIEKSKARILPPDVDTFDIIDHGPSRPREPWDTESADVFTRHFEQFESLLPKPSISARQLERFHPSQPPPQPLLVTVDPPAERAWLEGRFNDIATRISEMMVANGAGLGARFDSLEGRIDAAMTTVTSQATTGSDTLKQIETHIAEIDDHVDYIRSELMRLDGVEAQIRALMERQKSDAAARLQAPAASEGDAAVTSQLTALLQRLMAERRNTEEHTVTMLDTLQQAMIRVLDRMDAIETAQTENSVQPSNAAEHHTQRPGTQQPLEHHQHPLLAATAGAHEEAGAQPAPVAQNSYFMDFEEDEAGSDLNAASHYASTEPEHEEPEPELQSTITQIRRNFIADTERSRRPGPEVGVTQGTSPAPRHARPKRTLLYRLTHPTSKQLAVAALGLMVPLNGMFLYLVTKPAGQHEQAGMSSAAEDTITTGDKLTEASQALASEPPISKASEPLPPFEDLGRLGSPAAAEPIALKEPETKPDAAEVTNARLELPPATVGPLTLRRAAAEGDPSAQFEVGARLAEGKGIDQNFQSAIEWYQRSASHGFAQAQYRIGTHYERGLGVEKDPERARVWYQRAAEQGNVKAMHNIAVLSTNRPDGKMDYAEALRWFSEAAQYNLPDSQFNLAVLHESGLGVPKDPKTAYVWFALAARNGDKEAIKRREAVKSQLTADALAAADTEVRAFRGKTQSPVINDARVAGELWKKRQVGAN